MYMLIIENMCQIYVYKCKCYCSICLCSLSKHVRLDRKYHGRTHDFPRIPTSVVYQVYILVFRLFINYILNIIIIIIIIIVVVIIIAHVLLLLLLLLLLL